MNTKRELNFDEYTQLVDLAPKLLKACKSAQKLLLTPASERGSFAAVEVLHELGDIITRTERVTQA